MRPMWWVFSSPRCVQLRPASVDRYTPLPQGELWRLLGSPVPTHTTFGLEGATATAPTDAVDSSLKTCSKVIPAFSVFQTPPLATPT